MKIYALGGGVSSCLFAYQVKKLHPSYDVEIFESSDKILKRVLVSGNGRANFFNSAFIDKEDLSSYFINGEKLSSYINKKDAEELLSIIKDEMGMEYYSDSSGRMYPFSNLSSSLYLAFEKSLKKVGVKINLNSKVTRINPDKHQVYINESPREYSYLFLGIGGFAFDRSNSDNHYLLDDLKLPYELPTSGLCPLYVTNKIPSYLEGTRLKGTLSLRLKDKEIYKEEGELLFKKNGLSGICVFDASLFIDLNKGPYYISFNPFYHDDKKVTLNNNLDGILPINLVKYINEKVKGTIEEKDVLDVLDFKIKDKFSLRDSQISLGGVLSSSFDSSFKLKNYEDIFLGGEIINIHAICGGFNMGLSFLTGLVASRNIK